MIWSGFGPALEIRICQNNKVGMTMSSNYDFFTDQTLVSVRDPKVFLSCQIMDPFFYFTSW